MEPSHSPNLMLATPDLLGVQHLYRRCTIEDVDPHFAKIAHWIPEDEHEEFRNRMVGCLEAGTAWCTKNTFIYYLRENHRIANGYAMFGRAFPSEFLGLLIGVFWRQDKETYHLRFMLHPGKAVEEYKTMLMNWSMLQASKYDDAPLMVNIHRLRKKFHKILDDRIPE